MRSFIIGFTLAATAFTCGLAHAAPKGKLEKTPGEAEYYTISPFNIPEGIVLEGGGLEMMPDGKLAVSSRRGDIYFVSQPQGDPAASEFTKFAGGLHEVLGLAYKDGWLYATQRPELSRLKDTDNDGRADLFETVNDGWEISGDYHEYAFGSKPDKNGDQWLVLCLTGSFSSNVKFRGWCLRVTPEGKLVPTCSGVRSPGGIGMNAEGEMFYSENQGPWNGACALKHLAPGKFVGHPAGNVWYGDAPNMGPRPKEPTSGSRIMTEAKLIPEFEPPAILFPYGRMGQSASGIACDTTGGKFGPFTNQMFVGDQTNSTVMRVFLEKVNGHYQGACFPFLSGIGSGSLALLMTKEGSLFVTGTNRGWGSRGPKPYSLDRVNWSGKVPFEVQEMRAKPYGFDLVFTQPVDPKTAGDAASYKMNTFTVIYQSQYGSPEVDKTDPSLPKAVVSGDGKTVQLYVDGLQEGHIHELSLAGVRNAEGEPLLHDKAYYTLNYLAK